jgi:hypothetical protein
MYPESPPEVTAGVRRGMYLAAAAVFSQLPIESTTG